MTEFVRTQCPSFFTVDGVGYHCLHGENHEGPHWNRRLGWSGDPGAPGPRDCGIKYRDEGFGDDTVSEFWCQLNRGHVGDMHQSAHLGYTVIWYDKS